MTAIEEIAGDLESYGWTVTGPSADWPDVIHVSRAGLAVAITVEVDR